jgi:hypothetical protein
MHHAGLKNLTGNQHFVQNDIVRLCMKFWKQQLFVLLAGILGGFAGFLLGYAPYAWRGGRAMEMAWIAGLLLGILFAAFAGTIAGKYLDNNDL